LFAGILMASGPVFAQSESSGESSSGGAGSGDLLIELTGSPFNTGGGLLNFSEFRTRFFLNDIMAVRLGIAMNLDNTQTTPDVVVNNSSYSIMPGFEYHLVNEGAFRAYGAADLMVGHRIANYSSSTGPSVVGAASIPSSPTAFISNRGYFQLGARVSAGVEYHFNSRFYIGGEVGFQYIYQKNAEVSVDGELWQESTTDNFGFLTTANSIKIGFKFLNF
ncbi:outer membrane beta-barrel protein, partial [Marivirga sp. S37H4]